jgi:hypothetical protein
MSMICEICSISSYTTIDHKTNYKEPQFQPTTFYICLACENILGYGLNINLQIIYFLYKNINQEARIFDEKNQEILRMLDRYLDICYKRFEEIEFPKKQIMVQKFKIFIDIFYDQYIEHIQDFYEISLVRAIKSCEHLLIFKDPLSNVMRGLTII